MIGFDAFNDDERTREIIARTIEFIQTNLRKEYKPGTPPLPSAGRIFTILINGNLEKALKLVEKVTFLDENSKKSIRNSAAEKIKRLKEQSHRNP